MPFVGFGLWKVTKSSCADTVYTAIKNGYRLLDGAGDYGNEKEAGEGVRRAISDGLVKREDLFITSKLWNTFHAKEHLKPMAKMQLQLWGIKYFDLYLVHFPVSLAYVDPKHRYPPEWWGDDKKTVTLGNLGGYGRAGGRWDSEEYPAFSNTQGSLITDIIRYAKIQPQVLQVEVHPYLTQEPLIQLAKTLGIAVTAYSSFGPQSYLELGMGQGISPLFETDVVNSAAKRLGRTRHSPTALAKRGFRRI
ncbi:hypothetical protein MPER_01564, partial [Moniliophthora perniciosa FA553]